MRQPVVNFVIAGVMKAGTTAAVRALAEHDQTFLLEGRESFYFVQHPAAFSPISRLIYERRFAARGPAVAVGEKCASYLFYPHALWLLRRYNPGMRVIVFLRDPVERAYSHWNMNRQKGIEHRSFEDAVAAEIRRPEPIWRRNRFTYLERGIYAPQLRRLWRLFPPEHCLILDSAAFRRRPDRVWAEMLGFLSLDQRPAPKRMVRHARAYDAPMGEDVQAQLRAYFADDIAAVEAMLGWDLTAWRGGVRIDGSVNAG